MSKDLWAKLTKLSGIALGALAVGYLGVYVLQVIFRLGYPFELEWMEGGSVEHVRRVLSGQPLYVPPSLDFVPYIYTPLYYYVSAVFSLILGEGFLPLRLVSFLSSLGCLALIFLHVKGETQDPFSGLLAAGLFAAAFRAGGAWLDLARVDSLFLFLMLFAIYLTKCRTTLPSVILAGVALGLSYLTKQVAGVIALPFLVAAFLWRGKKALWLLCFFGAIVGASTVFFDLLSQGWYGYYVFLLSAHHTWGKAAWLSYWAKDLMGPLGPACLLALLALFPSLSGISRKNAWFYLLTVGGLVGGSWFSRLHAGGYDNVLLPAYAGIALLSGQGFSSLDRMLRTLPVREGSAFFLRLALLIQFVVLAYPPWRQIPTPQDRQAGREFLNVLSSLPGDVFVPYHAYLPRLAGKRSRAQAMAVYDVLRGDSGPARDRLAGEIFRAFESRSFDFIILDGEHARIFPFDDSLKLYYRYQGPLFSQPGVFWPITGYRTRPELLFVPK